MPASPTRFIKRCAQWLPKSEACFVPHHTRGVYALLQFRRRQEKYDVVYIGMAASGGIRSRLRSHKKSESKIWSHFSIFEVWDNISENEVEELEGLFREIYRKDGRANRFNRQKKFKKLQSVRKDELRFWKPQAEAAV
jgi:hypothetical protein